MAKTVTSTDDKSADDGEAFLADADSSDFDGDEEVAPVRASPRDPGIRRKIEERLERKRLRDELGIYDDDLWEDL